jgi:hypothetical protein
MKHCICLLVLIIGLSLGLQASAGINLVTVSEPAAIRLIVYQPADLCLVREHREISLQPGVNRLRLSWHGLLLDPTSLEITPRHKNDEPVRILDLSFSARARDQAICLVETDAEGEIPIDVSYLLSGVRWQPGYTAILAQDESSLRLESLVTITNRSGKSYEEAHFSLLTGDTHLVDRLADLARVEDPYGRPREQRLKTASESLEGTGSIAVKRSLMSLDQAAATAPPEITREGVSDFFLFTIDGVQSIRNGWSKSLRMFATEEAAAVNRYKYDESRYGNRPVRFITFVNAGSGTREASPLPAGDIIVYRNTGPNGRLGYEGRSRIPYVAPGETVELNLGAVSDVIVEPTLLDAASDRYAFDRKGNISGWDEIHAWKIEIYNTRPVPVQVQVDRHAPTSEWDVDYDPGKDAFRKIDKRTFRFKKTLAAGESKTIEYTITSHHGTAGEKAPKFNTGDAQ